MFQDAAQMKENKQMRADMDYEAEYWNLARIFVQCLDCMEEDGDTTPEADATYNKLKPHVDQMVDSAVHQALSKLTELEIDALRRKFQDEHEC